MLSVGILCSAFVAYWLGHYEAAFWATVVNMANGGLAAFAAVRNPDWYIERRREAFPDEGIITTVLDAPNQIRQLVITKVFTISISAVIAWYFGSLAGYF